MKIAVVTGITGQDGSYLAELLLEKDYRVYGIMRRSSNINTKRIEHLFHNDKLYLRYGDLTDSIYFSNILNEIDTKFGDIEVIEIYNLAAMSHVKISFELPEYTGNVDGIGVLRILESIRNFRLHEECRFYQASTSEMFGKMEQFANENTMFYPRSPYGVAKLYGHWITINYRESYDMFNCSGILFNHESERRGHEFVTRKITDGVAKIHLGLQDKIMLGNLDTKRDWGYSPDYVEAMWMMLQQDEPDNFVCATGISHSVQELVEYTFNKLDLDWKQYVETDAKYLRPEELKDLKGDSTKLRELGWTAEYTFETMIDEMIEYWMEIL